MASDTMVPKVAKMQFREARTHGRRAVARKEAKGKKKVARAIAKRLRLVAKKRTHCSVVSYAVDEDDGH